MSGRPSRLIRLQPTWNIAYINDVVFVTDDEGEVEGTISNDIEPMSHHWAEESALFERELEKWQKFRACQRKPQNQERLETELELGNTDEALLEGLSRLSDWQEFEMFQGRLYHHALCFEDRCRRSFLWITSWEVLGEPNAEVHGAICTWLLQMMRCQRELEAEKKDLDWIKDEWPKIIAEVADSVSHAPKLQSSLEAKFRKQTYATFSAIQNLGGRPSHTVSQPNDGLDDLQRLLHWSSETSTFMKELSEWKMFLAWRREKLGDASTMQGQVYRCPTFESPLDRFAELEEFRRFEHDVAMTWLKCWQRVVRWHEEEQKNPDQPGWLHDYSIIARSHMADSKQKVTDATTLLEKSIQEYSNALSQLGKPVRDETKTRSPQIHTLPTPPPSDSGSSRSSRSLSSGCAPSSTRFLEPSQPAQSPERPFQDRRASKRSRSARKIYRRSKKEDARKYGRKMENINTDQQPLPSFPVPPPQVEIDDDAEMVDAQEDQSPVEGAEEYLTPESEDIVMADFEDVSSHTLLDPPRSHSEPITGKQTSRKIQSGRKVNQKVPAKVLKNTGKKPAKKAKTFTEKQTIALLNAASTKDSSKESPQPRRSERLQEKAADSAIISSSPIPLPQQNADHTCPSLRRSERLQERAASSAIIPSSPTPPSPTPLLHQKAEHTSPSSEQKQPLETLDPVEPSRPSRRRKSKKGLNMLEPHQTSGRKKSKISKPVVEPYRSSRQKTLGKQARDAARWDP